MAKLKVTIERDGTLKVAGDDTQALAVRKALEASGTVTERHVGHAVAHDHVDQSDEVRQEN